MHATPYACELATGFFLHQVGTKGQLVFLPSSALHLGNFEKISDVQQCLVDVVPKALGILWAQLKSLDTISGQSLPLCTHKRMECASGIPQIAPLCGTTPNGNRGDSLSRNLRTCWKHGRTWYFHLRSCKKPHNHHLPPGDKKQTRPKSQIDVFFPSHKIPRKWAHVGCCILEVSPILLIQEMYANQRTLPLVRFLLKDAAPFCLGVSSRTYTIHHPLSVAITTLLPSEEYSSEGPSVSPCP